MAACYFRGEWNLTYNDQDLWTKFSSMDSCVFRNLKMGDLGLHFRCKSSKVLKI